MVVRQADMWKMYKTELKQAYLSHLWMGNDLKVRNEVFNLPYSIFLKEFCDKIEGQICMQDVWAVHFACNQLKHEHNTNTTG